MWQYSDLDGQASRPLMEVVPLRSLLPCGSVRSAASICRRLRRHQLETKPFVVPNRYIYKGTILDRLLGQLGEKEESRLLYAEEWVSVGAQGKILA